MTKLKDYKYYLSEKKITIYDGYCGEPVAWGYKLIRKMSQDKYNDIKQFGEVRTIYERYGNPDYYLITKKLTRTQAIKKYGNITNETFGPRGGWKHIIFGKTKFISKTLKER